MAAHQELLVNTAVLKSGQLDPIEQVHGSQRTVRILKVGKSEALGLIRRRYETLEG